MVRLGGFHLLMSFMRTTVMIVCVSGLKELLSTIYAEKIIAKMLYGHAYSRDVRFQSLVYLSLAISY